MNIMRANLINEHAQSIYYDATRELSTAVSKKARFEEKLADYQTDLDRMFQNFAKPQIVQNISAQSQTVQSFVENANDQAASQQAKLSILTTDIAQLNDEKQRVLTQIANEREIAQTALLVHRDYSPLAKQIAAAELRLQTVSADSQSLLAEVTSKLDSYAAHPVFVYLRAAKFGTSEYKSSLLSRLGDRILAKKYTFAEMEKAFLTLQRLQSSASSSQAFAQEEFETCSRALKALERTVSDVTSYRSATAALGRIETELSLCLTEEHRLKASLAQHKSYSTQGHEQAMEIVIRNLLVMPAEALAQLSRATESNEDDEALSNITRLRACIIDTKQDLQMAESEYTEASLKLQRAQSLREMLDNTRYSSKDYRYDNQSNIEGLLLGYLVGSMSADAFIDKLDSQCSYLPDRTPSMNLGSSDNSIFQTSDSFDDSSYRQTDSPIFNTTDSIDDSSHRTTDSF